MMASLGNSRTPFKLFEAEVIPALLFNAESFDIIFNSEINLLYFNLSALKSYFSLQMSFP